MASQEIFVVVQIVLHVFKWIEALCLMDGRFVVLFIHVRVHAVSLFCVSILFKFEISCHCESFFKNLTW